MQQLALTLNAANAIVDVTHVLTLQMQKSQRSQRHEADADVANVAAFAVRS
jgi:hypothetical protein